mmetsp:Transcript_27993/g.39429  ORF Transcript_27993/g.39429 Transcript_27993/m.39429 type:complete len:394 (-) Transcript_27993:169-1350(-)
MVSTPMSTLVAIFFSSLVFSPVASWTIRPTVLFTRHAMHSAGIQSKSSCATAPVASTNSDEGGDSAIVQDDPVIIFQEFTEFLQKTQTEIIATLEAMDGSGAKFSRDTWGKFLSDADESTTMNSGGITRVIQGGDIIEKGACSLTLIQQGVLTAERAAAIRGRQKDGFPVNAGDTYSAAALSIVLHSRSPLVPTFRSDVRIFLVQHSADNSMAWFGGGADLTPYYLVEDDISEFHAMYKGLCDNSLSSFDEFSYETMKKACDDYFYLPARSEHRGTGGIFFDDMEATTESLEFVQGVSNTWMPSWLPIIERHRDEEYTDQQRQWQLLRRGRYLEFNLLYDRGVKFGLANANPRVEGVMVSAPPLIAWEYNHVVEEGSPEAKIMTVLKQPREWV